MRPPRTFRRVSIVVTMALLLVLALSRGWFPLGSSSPLSTTEGRPTPSLSPPHQTLTGPEDMTLARRRFNERLKRFLIDPRTRASHHALRQPSPCPDPVWLRQRVLGEILELNTVFRTRVAPRRLVLLATTFVGLFDLFLRLPPLPDDERDVLFVELGVAARAFISLCLRSESSHHADGFVQSLEASLELTDPSQLGDQAKLQVAGTTSLPIYSTLVREFEKIRAREKEEGRGHPVLEILHATTLHTTRFEEKAQSFLQDYERKLMREAWTSSPAHAGLQALLLRDLAQSMANLGDIVGLTKVHQRMNRLAPRWEQGSRLPPAWLLAIQVHRLFIGAHFDRPFAGDIRKAGLRLCEKIMADHDEPRYVPFIHRPLLAFLREREEHPTCDRLERTFATTLAAAR